jgi:putative oxidoreductase
MRAFMQGTRLAHAVDLAGRALLAAPFVLEGGAKLDATSATAGYMASFGMSSLLLGPAIALELGAGLALLLGWRTRTAALLLAMFCAAAAIVFHRAFADHNQLLHFEKDLALAGALLVIGVCGAGRFSLDHRRASRRQRKAADPIYPAACATSVCADPRDGTARGRTR